MFIYRSESKPPDAEIVIQTDQNMNRRLNSIIHASTSIEERGMLYIQKETESLKIQTFLIQKKTILYHLKA